MERPHDLLKPSSSDPMMIYSRPTFHLTPNSNLVQPKRELDVSITLANDLNEHFAHQGVCKAKLTSALQKVSQLETLLLPDASMSSLSIQTLTRKHIEVLSMPGFAVFYDLRDDSSLQGYVEQVEDGLFYLCEDDRTNL